MSQDSKLHNEDLKRQEMAEKDSTCISESQLCDGCYDCHIDGIDELNELCHGKLKKVLSTRINEKIYKSHKIF